MEGLVRTEKIELHDALKKYFGFSKFKGLQEEVIKAIVAGEIANHAMSCSIFSMNVTRLHKSFCDSRGEVVI